MLPQLAAKHIHIAWSVHPLARARMPSHLSSVDRNGPATPFSHQILGRSSRFPRVDLIHAQVSQINETCSSTSLLHIVTDLLSALLSNGSVNKPQQGDSFYVVRDTTVATQRRSKQMHLCSNWSTHNNEKCVRSFLCSRRRGYITRHWWDARQFSVNSNEVTVLVTLFKSSRRDLWIVLLWREDLCVTVEVWKCYSLCVESRCWETTSGVREILVREQRWSVNCVKQL
jgi:hypothetical protein